MWRDWEAWFADPAPTDPISVPRDDFDTVLRVASLLRGEGGDDGASGGPDVRRIGGFLRRCVGGQAGG